MQNAYSMLVSVFRRNWQEKCIGGAKSDCNWGTWMTRQFSILSLQLVVALIFTANGLAVARSADAVEGGYQPLAAIHEAVSRFVRKRFQGPGVVDGVIIEHLDPRLRLTACAGGVQLFLPPGQPSAGRLTVGVRCRAPKPWRLYVPVRVTRHIEVLIAARPLPRGIALSADAIRHGRRDPAELPGAWYTERSQLLGLETRRAIRAGEVLSPQLLSSARLIRRGQELVLFATSGSMTVTVKGKALEDGVEGDIVRVRNLSSDRVVEGRVVGTDKVQVSL